MLIRKTPGPGLAAIGGLILAVAVPLLSAWRDVVPTSRSSSIGTDRTQHAKWRCDTRLLCTDTAVWDANMVVRETRGMGVPPPPPAKFEGPVPVWALRDGDVLGRDAMTGSFGSYCHRSYGFPFRCAAYFTWLDINFRSKALNGIVIEGATTRWSRPAKWIIPYGILWTGMLTDAACYAGGIWFVQLFTCRLARRIRSARGCCSRCGYHLLGVVSQCPECSATTHL